MNKKTAIVLGGLKSHIILIEKLKARGYYTVLVDYLDAPPAAAFADEHVQISTFDLEGIKTLARERSASVIINCCLEHLNAVICQAAEELGLPMMYSYQTALDVSDKRRMKSIMKKNDIPTTDFACVSSIDELEDLKLSYPIFVKPADGSGSTGVNKVVNDDELKYYTEIALKYSKNGTAIVEEAAVGKECNVYCVIQEGKATVLTLSEKYSEIRGSDKTTKAIGSLWPAQVSEGALENMRKAAQKIADGFHIKTTPMFMQLMVNGDEINIIEFACRMAGGYSYKNILNRLGFDYFDFTIDAYTGAQTTVNIHNSSEYSAINSIYASPCTFDRIEGFEELYKEGIITEYLTARNSGTEVTDESANRAKIGFFIVCGNNIDDLLAKIKYVFEHIEAYDINGNTVMRKDLYLTADLLK